MKIGIDTDGVLTDMSTFLRLIGKQYLKREPVKKEAYNIEEMFATSKSEKLHYGISLFINYCKNCPPREKAQKVIEQLNKDGHELFEITARKFVTMKNPLGWYSKKLLLKWYEKHGFHFSKVIFCSEKNTGEAKTKACIEHGAKIMVEDRPEVAEYLVKNGITVLLFDAPYNKNLKHERIIRVHNWDEVYEKINEFCFISD